MDAMFAWIESSAASTWLKESPSIWALPFVLVLHTWGLAFLVGVNVAIDARILGVASLVPIASLQRYFPLMWTGFWMNAISGTALVVAYPTKALTNPVFYVKLAFVGAGVLVARRIGHRMRALPTGSAPSSLKRLAVVSLTCWVIAIVAGRLLAYTYTRLSVDYAG